MSRAKRRVGRPAAADLSKGEGTLWREAMNPLRGLTVTKAVAIFDNARLGCYADLMWLYNEIEAADPTLLICAERRAAGVEELDWSIATKKAGRVGAAWDETLAAEQVRFLEAAYGACGNLLDGIEALSAAFFRGFAHVLPRYATDGLALTAVERLDGWNFAFNRRTGRWHWNPEAHSAAAVESLAEIPETELASVVRTRHIDYPALSIYIRAALGEKQWGLFMERYGVPPVMIVMPEFADATDEARYLEAAQRVARGGSGALPYGSQVTYATEARGTNPFSEYLKHQQELVVLLATGGIATSLAMPAGLGNGPSDEHGDTWRTIVRRDARVIAQAFNRRVTADLLAAAYPGRPALAEFVFDTEATPSAAEVFDAGAKAVTAGYRIVQGELEAKSGYRLEQAPAASSPQMTQMSQMGAAQNKSAAAGPSIEEAAVEALAEARAKGLAPVIDRLLDALAETDEAAMRESLAALYADLPGLVAATAAPETDVALVERILSDAVGAGARESRKA